MLPPRREANFSFFVLSRPHPSDGLLDPILGALGAVLGFFLGLLGLSWALLGGRTSRAEGPEEASKGSLELSWAMVGVSGVRRVLFRALWGHFRASFRASSGALSVLFAVLKLSTCRSTALDKTYWQEPLYMQTPMCFVLGRRRAKGQ